jgi:hypothetical protein
MLILLLILATARAQAIAGPITDCPVMVEVVDVTWDVMPGVDVTVRDERTQRKETKHADNDGKARFVVQSCPDDRCRFTISASWPGFKSVTLKRVGFGANQNDGDRHVQIRLDKPTGGVTIR